MRRFDPRRTAGRDPTARRRAKKTMTANARENYRHAVVPEGARRPASHSQIV
jgi:hypothetical protein